jgi:hypothetical protein
MHPGASQQLKTRNWKVEGYPILATEGGVRQYGSLVFYPTYWTTFREKFELDIDRRRGVGFAHTISIRVDTRAAV